MSRPTPPARRRLFSLAALLLSLFLTALLGEGLVRLSGRDPFTYNTKDANEPLMNEPDPLLGWQAREGVYRIPAYDGSAGEVLISFRSRGRRATGPTADRPGPGLVIVGGSYTQGFAIDDDQTYPWRLQERYPDLNVVNYGTSAYGGYQSLMMLERELPRIEAPEIVLYGFHAHHEKRNVATASWLRGLAKYSRRGHVDVPFATLDGNDELVRNPPASYPAVPLRDRSALVAFVEELFVRLSARSRSAQGRAVSRRVMVEMAEVSRAHGAEFLVVTLFADDQTGADYSEFLEDRGIGHLDCAHPVPEEMRVPGEGHPGGAVNAFWAECIADALESRNLVQVSSPTRE